MHFNQSGISFFLSQIFFFHRFFLSQIFFCLWIPDLDNRLCKLNFVVYFLQNKFQFEKYDRRLLQTTIARVKQCKLYSIKFYCCKLDASFEFIEYLEINYNVLISFWSFLAISLKDNFLRKIPCQHFLPTAFNSKYKLWQARFGHILLGKVILRLIRFFIKPSFFVNVAHRILRNKFIMFQNHLVTQ